MIRTRQILRVWPAVASGILVSETVLAAPPLPFDILQQLDEVVGQRVEATAVIGTQNIASRSGMGWKLNDADGEVFKLPWKFEMADPRPVAGSWVEWTPVCEGGAGYGSFQNHFNDNVLAGNESDYDTVALSVGAGPRFYFGDSGFSVLPAFDFLFAYTENHFTAYNPVGQVVVNNGDYVNWKTWTVSFVPSFELRYKKTFGRWTPEFTSTAAYFNTVPLDSSTDAMSFHSHSTVWANKLDVDYLTPWEVAECPLHLGGNFTRTDLHGGIRASMNTDHYYEADGRFTFDVKGKLWKVTEVGVAGGYFWSGAFDGFSIGLTGSVKF